MNRRGWLSPYLTIGRHSRGLQRGAMLKFTGPVPLARAARRVLWSRRSLRVNRGHVSTQ